MKKYLISSVAALCFSSSLFAASFTADVSHSSVEFSIAHLVVSEVSGKFKDFAVTADFDPATSALNSVSATIQTASIDTEHTKRDQHLKSPDFFNVEKHEAITFTSTDITQEGKSYSIEGQLTMNGVTKPVVLKGKLLGYINDPNFGSRAGFVVKTTIDRKDFGLTWSRVMDGGGLVVGDEVAIQIRIEGVEDK